MLANRKCPVCGGKEVDLIETFNFVMPAEYKKSHTIPLVSCGRCGFVYKDLQETAGGEKSIVKGENRYEAFEQDFTKAYLEEEAQVILSRFGRDMKILDVGCCTGYLLHILMEQGARDCQGLEPSAMSCRRAMERGVKVTEGTVYEELPGYVGCFDLIILSQVLEHISDLQLCVRRLRQWLREDGFLFISVPDEAHCGEYYGSLSSVLSAEHVNHFGSGSLDRLMAGGGFLPVYHEERPYYADPDRRGDRGAAMASFDSVYQKTDQKTAEEFHKDQSVSVSVKKLLAEYKAKRAKLRENTEALLQSGLRFYIWGVSHMAMNLLDEELRDVNVVGFTDSDPSKHGLHVRNLPVVPPGLVPGGTGILVLDNHAKDSILNSIKEYGLSNPVFLV